MDTPDAVLACFKTHAARGMEKYPDFTTPTEALDAMTPYLQAARNAAASPADPVCQRQFAKAIARVGGLLLKTYANLEIQLVPAATLIPEAPPTVPPCDTAAPTASPTA